MEEELNKLKSENAALKEQLKYFVPRRRVRRVYKQLKKILEQDIENNNQQYIGILIDFIVKIEKEGKAEAGQEVKTAIEHLLSITDPDEEVG